MKHADFPVFDLGAFEAADGAARRSMGETVDSICRTTGFLAIGNHGAPQAAIDGVRKATAAFFDLPREEKVRAAAPYPGYPYGWLGPGTEALAKSRHEETPPDLKESFNGGPEAAPSGLSDREALAFCYAPTIWPQRPEGFREAWTGYYREMEMLAARIMRLFAVALRLSDDWFEPFIDRPISALRALNYPAQATAPLPGQLRAGAHTDYGSLTILLPQPGSRGLEILSPGGKWVEVPPVDGAFIVNIGDLMALWTNDRWVSTLHRVVNPHGGQAGVARQSLAFFHQPNWDARIETIPGCLNEKQPARHAPVLSGPYLMGKFRATTA